MHTTLRPALPTPRPSLRASRPLFASLSLAAALLAGVPGAGAAGQAGDWQAAIDNPVRSAKDRAADARRKPAEFLAFAQVRPGMKVLDVASGGGATAALLTAAVGPNGDVWAQNPAPNATLDERLGQPGAARLHTVVADFENPVPARTPPLDLITINMSYHDIANTQTDRAVMDKRLYQALKPGGVLVIVDNSARKGAGLSVTKTLHRIDEDTVVAELTRAGFKLDGRSDYLRAPDDPRDQPFFKMNGVPDDKFALRFKK